jgi:hypothetical protein
MPENESRESARSRAATSVSTAKTGSNVNTALPAGEKPEDIEARRSATPRAESVSRLIGDDIGKTVNHPMGLLVEECERCPTVRGSVQTLVTGIAIKILQFRENPEELTKIAAGLLNSQEAISESILKGTSVPAEDKPVDVSPATVERLAKSGV